MYPGTQTVPSTCYLVMQLSLCQLSFPVQLLLPLCLSVYYREAKNDSVRHEQQAKTSSSSPRLFLTPRANNHVDARELGGFKDTMAEPNTGTQCHTGPVSAKVSLRMKRLLSGQSEGLDRGATEGRKSS